MPHFPRLLEASIECSSTATIQPLGRWQNTRRVVYDRSDFRGMVYPSDRAAHDGVEREPPAAPCPVFSATTSTLNSGCTTPPRLDAVWNFSLSTIFRPAALVGIEFAFALLLIDHGHFTDGVQIVEAINRRYLRAGQPWNHVECGGHYSPRDE